MNSRESHVGLCPFVLNVKTWKSSLSDSTPVLATAPPLPGTRSGYPKNSAALRLHCAQAVCLLSP